MKRSELGAARVSMVWLIGVIVLFFVACAVAFIAFDESGKIKKEYEANKVELASATDRADQDAARVQAISNAVGWYDREAAARETNLELLGTDLNDLRTAFPDLGSNVQNLQDALPAVKQAYAARGTEIDGLKSQITALQSEKKAIEDSLRKAVAQKDTELADLRRQLDDASAAAASKQTELENARTALRNQLSNIDAELRDQRGKTEESDRKYADELTTWETRFREQGKKLNFIQKEPATPDGEVLAVADDVSLGWINIGAKHRLGRGMRFQVVSGRVGSSSVKALAEVVSVEAEQAEVRFVELSDRFDPVVPGDLVFNPLFDPTGERHAVLAGRFSIPNETEIQVLLKNMGITVQKELDLNTDFLIVGSELFVDEDGQPYETPLSPAELPVYKNAEQQGVAIIPIKELRRYFKF